MASGPITLWQIDGQTMETVTDFIFLGSKITVDDDCSHELAGWSILVCRFFPFVTLNILCHSLLACRVSVEKSADNLMGVLLYVISCFSLVAFNILSLSLIFVCWITMYLSVFFLGFILLGTLCASWTWLTIPFLVLGKFSVIISLFSWAFSLSLLFLGPL